MIRKWGGVIAWYVHCLLNRISVAMNDGLDVGGRLNRTSTVAINNTTATQTCGIVGRQKLRLGMPIVICDTKVWGGYRSLGTLPFQSEFSCDE